MNKLLFAIAILASTLFGSCAQNKNDYLITIKTSQGEMVAILYDETLNHPVE